MQRNAVETYYIRFYVANTDVSGRGINWFLIAKHSMPEQKLLQEKTLSQFQPHTQKEAKKVAEHRSKHVELV